MKSALNPTVDKLVCIATIALFISLSSSSANAGTYEENVDAGNLPGIAQNTEGMFGDSLDTITGNLSNASGGDMYRIVVTGLTPFSATTVPTPNGLNFLADSVLYLFDENGIGIYANNDSTGTDPRSTLPARSIAPGVYNILIGSPGRVPRSTGGAIFPVPASPTDVVDATGSGASQVVSSYIGTGTSAGRYAVALTGTRFAVAVPEASPLSLIAVGLSLGAVGVARRRLTMV